MPTEETVIVCAECDGNHELTGLTWDCPNGDWDGVSQCPECGTIEGPTKEITYTEWENS